MLPKCASADSFVLEDTTILTTVSNPGFPILFSIPSSSFGSAEYLAVSGFASFFLVLERYVLPCFFHFPSAGDTMTWIAAPSPSPIFARTEVMEERGSVGKSLKTFIGI